MIACVLPTRPSVDLTLTGRRPDAPAHRPDCQTDPLACPADPSLTDPLTEGDPMPRQRSAPPAFPRLTGPRARRPAGQRLLSAVLPTLIGVLVGSAVGPSVARAAPQAAPQAAAPAPAAFPPMRSDVVASAQASTDDPSAADSRTGTLWLLWSRKSTATATASAHCDGCSADAQVSVEVRVPTATTVRADNVATAWAAGCQGCAASAVSIQIVLARSSLDLHVNNRALAVNAACVECTSTAIAVQYVLVGAAIHAPSDAQTLRAPAGAEQLAAQLARNGSDGRPFAARATVLSGVEQTRVALQRQYGAASVVASVDYRTG